MKLKKMLGMILTTLTLLGLCSCSDPTPPPPEPDPPKPIVQEEPRKEEVKQEEPKGPSKEEIEQEIADDLVYEVYNSYVEDGRLIVDGYIVNRNVRYDILGLEDTEIYLADRAGMPLCTLYLKEDYQEELRLRPQSKSACRLAVDLDDLEFDADEYYALNEGLMTDIECIFNYSKCDGSSCSRCHGEGLKLNENVFTDPEPKPDPEPYPDTFYEPEDMEPRRCAICHGSGKCSTCRGRGVMKAMGDSMLGDYCRTCGGTGDCQGCFGLGYLY